MNATDRCTGDWPLSMRSPVAVRNNDLTYHSIGPISNFSAAMQGCCGSAADIFDGGLAPYGCYWYCLFEDGSQDDFAKITECINQRALAVRRRLQEQNITGSGHMMEQRGPNASSAANEGKSVNLGIWRVLVVGLAVVGGVVGVV